jgi:kynureninase
LTPSLLRQISQHQVRLLRTGFDDLSLDPALIRRERAVPLDRLGGFLALTSPRAGAIHQALLKEGVHTDFRGDILRLGPAPYLSDRQLHDAVSTLGEVAQSLPRSTSG